MLYDLATGELTQVPDWGKKKLKELFPEFYAGKSLRLVTCQGKQIIKHVHQADYPERPPRQQVTPCSPKGVKTKGSIVSPEGKTFTYQYTSSIPRKENNTIIFDHYSSNVSLEEGFVISPDKEDLLFFLIFGCTLIKGNLTGKESDPYFEFYRPAVTAKSEIAKSMEESKLKSFIYEQCPYDKIEETMGIMGVKLSDEMDEKSRQELNRYTLFKAIETRGDTFKNNALSTLGYLGDAKIDVSNKMVESASDLINRLVDEDKISLKEDGWYAKDKRGDGTKWKTKPFFETTLQDSDARFALIDFFNANEKILNEYREL